MSTATAAASVPVDDRARTRFMLISSVASGLALTAFAIWAPGWVSATVWAFGLSLLYLGYALFTRDRLMLRFILFGMLAGWVELLPDHWLVAGTHTLVYAPGEPIVDSSPLYMPFSWLAVLLQVGYFGWLFARRVPMWVAMIGTGLLGAMVIPFYEHISIVGGWWSYRDTPMVLGVPYYIILAEGLLMTSIPPMFRAIERLPARYIPLLAVLQGLVMWGASALAFRLVG